MSTPESSELAKRLEAAERQLALYARDLRHVFGAERERAEQLRSANRQLQAYARDLRSSFLAEQKRAQDLERAYHDTVLRLVRATRYKDDETGAHVVRLSHYARYLARERGWKPEAAQLLFDAAPMHDVGKIGVPYVRAVATPDGAQVAVVDQGLGIPADAIPRLFTRFFRVDSPQARGIRGTGLGLALVKQLVELQAGSVWAESVLGQGSTLYFSVPFAKQKLR